jgi:DNA primase
MFWRITFLPCSAQEPVHAIFVDYLRIRKGTGTSQLFIRARSALTLWTPTSDELDSLIRTDWRAMRTAVKRMQQLSSGPAMILDEATAPNFGQAKRFVQLRPGESIQHQTPTEGL